MSIIDPIVEALHAVYHAPYGCQFHQTRRDECLLRAKAERNAGPIAAAVVAARAEAWAEGYATCLGDFDIAARRESRSPNPYRVEDQS